MLLSFNWLKDFLPELSASPTEIAEKLTLHAFEVEVSHELVVPAETIVTKITKLEPHPDADRLRLATISTGDEEITVVCGAPNTFEGAIVPYSPVGTEVLDPEGNKFKLSRAKIRGVESPGMLNSPRELGLGESHEGIYILPDHLELGSSLAEHIPVDTILEADITPNRAHDCMSHRGIAKEISIIFNVEFKDASTDPLPEKPLKSWDVSIQDPDYTSRYTGTLLPGVKVNPAPMQMQARLWAVGAKPINNIVDITNYALIEYGQPSHAFDTSLLKSQNIGVRHAKPGEKITALDETEYTLTDQDLVITDDDEAVSIGGVMGGQNSGIQDTTEEVFLELANFDAFTVQETSRRLKLISESSRRFAKGITPELVTQALSRILYLFREHTGAKPTGIIDNYPKPHSPQAITFSPARVSQLTGQEFSAEKSIESLQKIGCEIEGGLSAEALAKADEGFVEVTPPASRLDLSLEEDLVEEIIRLESYQVIDPNQPEVAGKSQPLPEEVQAREAIRDVLIGSGFAETLNYSFHDSGDVEIANPTAPEHQSLRSDILPQVINQIRGNIGEIKSPMNKEIGLFEIGTVFSAGDSGKVAGVVEDHHLAVASLDKSSLKAAIEKISQTFGVAISSGVSRTTPRGWFWSGEVIDRKLGKIHTLELSISELIRKAENIPSWVPEKPGESSQFMPFSQFPPVYRDISLLVPDSVTADQVHELISRTGGDLVTDVDLFDEWQPEGEGKLSLAFHIRYESFEKTLTDAEVNEVHGQIILALEKDLSAEIR